MARTITVNIGVNADDGDIVSMRNRVGGLSSTTADAENTVSGGFNGMGQAAATALGNIAADAIMSMAGQLREMAGAAIETGGQFEQQMADLSAITGIAGQDLEALGASARQSAIETGRSAQEQVEAYKLLASNIDIATAGGVEGLQRMGSEVVTLSQAANVELSTAADTVASSLNQFNLPADQSARIVNTLAAGAKEGAAEVGDLAETLKNAGTSAAGAGVSFEETVGAAEVLSQNALKGAEAGTQMRNVFTILQTESEKLAEAGIENVNLEADGLTGTLERLRPLMNDASALTEIFGRENQNAARLLIQNADNVDQMTQSVTGTNTAMDQAATQTDTWQGLLGRFDAVLEDLQIAFFNTFDDQLKGLIQDAMSLIQRYRDDFLMLLRIVAETPGPAFAVFQEVVQTVFNNFGDILYNALSSIPELIQIAMEGAVGQFQAYINFVRSRLSDVGTAAKAIGDLLIGAFTVDREQFNRGLESIKNVMVETAEDAVNLGQELGENYGESFRRTAEVLFNDVDTSGIQDKVDGFLDTLDRARQGGGGGAAPATNAQANQQPSSEDQRVQELQRVEAAERSLTSTIQSNLRLRGEAQIEQMAVEADVRKRRMKAMEAEQEAREEQIAQQVASTNKSIQTASDMANSVVGEVRRVVQARIAQTIASAIAPLGPAAIILGPAIAAGVNALFNSVIPEFRDGGEIRGPGGPRDDQIPIMASDREFMVNAASAQAAPNAVRAINDDPATARQIEASLQQGRPQGGSSADNAAAISGVEAAVREQTERLGELERVATPVREFSDAQDRYRQSETEVGR